MKNKRALIFGVSGQDGGLLSRFLIGKGYEVHGTSRDVESNPFTVLCTLGIKKKITLHSVSVNDSQSIFRLLSEVKPDEIYNLSGQSSVGLSFDQPVETIESVLSFTLKLLEVTRMIRLDTRIYQASSGEMFGNTSKPADETTPFCPRSPYAVAKAAAHQCIVNYREAYNIYACSGILFNHESEYRPSRFVTQTVAESVVRIAFGKQDSLCLGNLNIQRDWGWAEEYVETMWLMLQQQKPDDYVIATGLTSSLADFVKACFAEFGLDPEKYVKSDEKRFRPLEIDVSMANPKKAELGLKWQAKFKMPDVARRMTQAALLRHQKGE
jgi:GDPmannose 4,6-dehydratase